MFVFFRVLAVPFFLLAAYVWWITPGLDCDPMALGGCGLLDIGIGGAVGAVVNWLLVVVIALPGVALWKFAERFKREGKVEN